MKIVIEIPDEKYKDIMLQHNYDCRREGNCERIIANGTPLPKGHGRLADMELVKNAIFDLCNTGESLKDNPWRDNPHIDAICDVLDNAPTIIEADKDGD